MQRIKWFVLAVTVLIGCTGIGVAQEASTEPRQISRYVAIDNICAWPALVATPSSEIIAIVHNRPSHGQMEGEIEC